MRKKIIFLAGIIALSMILFISPKVKGEERNLIIMTLPDADTMVYGLFDENGTLIEGKYGGGDYEQYGHREIFSLGHHRFSDSEMYEYRNYIRLILPNKSSEIISLTLGLGIGQPRVDWGIDFPMNISLVSNNWDEHNINWTSGRPEYLKKYINVTIEITESDYQRVELNLTYFKDFVDNNTLSISLISYKQVSYSSINIYSKEESNIGIRPYLYVEYDEQIIIPESVPELEPEYINGFTFMQDYTIAIADTYVSSWYNTFNGGDLQDVAIGISSLPRDDYVEWREGYFKFNISERPENWTKVEIKLYSEGYPAAGTFTLEVYLVKEEWNETTMTWDNKPKKDIHIKNLDFYYYYDEVYDYGDTRRFYVLIDISDYIDDYLNDDETTISIGINASLNQMEDNYAIIYSKDQKYASNYLKPRLVWSYYVLDITPPRIQLHPLWDDLFGENAPTFTIDDIIDDSTIVSIWYTINDGLTNHTLTNFTETVNQSDWDAQNDGIITIWVYAEDIRGNIGRRGRIVKKDTTAPIITINAPDNNEKFGDNPPKLNITVTDDNLWSIWFQLIGETYISENLTWTGIALIEQDIWDIFRNENITIKFYAKDILEKIGSNSVTIEKSVYRYAEPTINGYNLFYLTLSTLGAVSLIIVIKMKFEKNKIFGIRGFLVRI